MHSLKCKRNLHQAKIRTVAESERCYFSLIFFAVLDSTNKYLKPCTYNIQIAPKIGEFEKLATVFVESRKVGGIHKQIKIHV